MRPVAALVPLKAFGGAKTRLESRLAPEARIELAKAMAADVLDALGAVPGLDGGVWVVTPAGPSAAWARNRGVRVVEEPPRPADGAASGPGASGATGLNAALEAGREAIRRAVGPCDLLVLPADLPLLRPGTVEALLRDRPAAGIRLVPDRRDDGTNALLLCPAHAIPFCYGPGSARAHAARARASGLGVEGPDAPEIAVDLDLPEDLDAVRAAPTGARHTRALLARHEGRTGTGGA